MIFNFYDIIGTMTEQALTEWFSLVRTDGENLLGNKKTIFINIIVNWKYILEIIKDPMNAIKTKKRTW